jgi:hypothetical protein
MDTEYSWLLSGDPSIAYLTKRDLLEYEDRSDKSRIGSYGWCAEYLKHRNSDGSWGYSFYQPKWISTHYVLLELRNLAYDQDDGTIQKEVERISYHELLDKSIGRRVAIGSDVCVCGMFLNYAAYFQVDQQALKHIVDFILGQQMRDGGFNCDHYRYDVTHSSLHSTLSVLEGFNSYSRNHFGYRIEEVRQAAHECINFMLAHKLFRSSTTNETIDQKFLRMTYPFRWKFTVLRALNCLVDMNVKYDLRMNDALSFLLGKRNKSGCWNLQSKFSGKEYIAMEDVGKPSRVITYFVLKILKTYGDYLG